MQSRELLPLLPRVFFYLQRDRDPFFSGNARLSEGGVQSGDVELLYVPPVLLSAGKFAFSIFVVYIEGGGGGGPPLFGSEAIMEFCQQRRMSLTCDIQVTMILSYKKKIVHHNFIIHEYVLTTGGIHSDLPRVKLFLFIVLNRKDLLLSSLERGCRIDHR